MRVVVIALAVLLPILAACDKRQDEIAKRQAQIEEAQRLRIAQEAAAVAREKEECSLSIHSLREQYDKDMTLQKYWDAARIVRKCANILNDSGLRSDVEMAELKGYEATIRDSKIAPEYRLNMLDKFSREYPENARALESLRAHLVSLQEQDERREEAKNKKLQEVASKAAAAARKKEGVSLGMSPEEVIASSWGRPQYVNRTTSAYGATEQWVYGGGNYLYFENGKLTSIQN